MITTKTFMNYGFTTENLRVDTIYSFATGSKVNLPVAITFTISIADTVSSQTLNMEEAYEFHDALGRLLETLRNLPSNAD